MQGRREMGRSPAQSGSSRPSGRAGSAEKRSVRGNIGLDGPGAREVRPQLGLQAGGKPERIPR